ncbi:hypothetical protein SAMN05444320_104502 [Streptoalloteichus hindustanus]|uniref:Helix-turn-helix domain-containing protein n=2 Tax=Streptoalloteichus hindustanus TaxID=2017 RepID=A0A1M5DKU7_STRHI|nr:hypothetical protein SAMN05444320_104502 [Streptoalloteichus hindustanus]
MRQLRKQSGLSYRELEKRAAARGDVLARSSIADVLSGKRLPRAELLTAFVLACGDDRVEPWLHALDRAGAQETSTDASPEPPAPGRKIRAWHVLLMSAVIVMALVAVIRSTLSGNDTVDGPTTSTGAVRPSLPTGWIRLRPITAPHLCLTDGRVRDGRHTPLVAVQRPCNRVAPQLTRLEPVGGDLYRIQWHHPDHGVGCLKALSEGPGVGLLEPWDACAESSHFHVEPSGEPAGNTYVLRVEGQGCVGIAGSDTTEGVEAVVSRCLGKGGQVFIIEPLP